LLALGCSLVWFGDLLSGIHDDGLAHSCPNFLGAGSTAFQLDHGRFDRRVRNLSVSHSIRRVAGEDIQSQVRTGVLEEVLLAPAPPA